MKIEVLDEQKTEAIPPPSAAPAASTLEVRTDPSRVFSDDDVKKARDILTCPISQLMFLNPVLTPCGHTFEKHELDTVCHSENKSCPTCRNALEVDVFPPNYVAKDLTQFFLDKMPELKNERYQPRPVAEQKAVPIPQRREHANRDAEEIVANDPRDFARFLLISFIVAPVNMFGNGLYYILSSPVLNQDELQSICMQGIWSAPFLGYMINNMLIDWYYEKGFLTLTVGALGGVGTWLLTDPNRMSICDNTFSDTPFETPVIRFIFVAIAMTLSHSLCGNLWDNLKGVPSARKWFVISSIALIVYMSMLLSYEYGIHLLMSETPCDDWLIWRNQGHGILLGIVLGINFSILFNEMLTLLSNLNLITEFMTFLSVIWVCGSLTWNTTDSLSEFITSSSALIDAPALKPLVQDTLTVTGMSVGGFVNHQAWQFWRNRYRLLPLPANARPAEEQNLLNENEQRQAAGYGALNNV